MTLVLLDPARAAATTDDCFEVRVVAGDGREVSADYATAITLTFLREALGCPLMRASELYRELLANSSAVRWGDVCVEFERLQLLDEQLHGVCVRQDTDAPVVLGRRSK